MLHVARRIAVGATLLAAIVGPRAARAQTYTFDYKNNSGAFTGTATLSASTPDGPSCGTYFCVTLLAGPAGPPQGLFWGIRASVASTSTTAAYDALGAARYEYFIPTFTSYESTFFSLLDPTVRPWGGRDQWSNILNGGSGRPTPSGAGLELQVSSSTGGSGSISVSLGPVWFLAYDASGRMVANERFSPGLRPNASFAALLLAPEPATLALTAAGLALVGVGVRRRRG